MVLSGSRSGYWIRRTQHWQCSWRLCREKVRGMLRTNRMNESGFRDESDEEGRVETSGSSFCSCTGTFPRRGGSSASRGGGSNAAWSYLPGTTITHGLCHSAFRSGSNSSYPGGLILPSEPEIILPPGKQSLCLPKQDRNSFAYLPKLIFRLQISERFI
jgi:hypothetical protein